MSVGCSTTQSNSVEREESAHMSQISSAAKKPQSLQDLIDWRVSAIARAICSGLSSRARTIQSAIRSAERGPTPGICRSCAIKSRIAAGYSVLLNMSSDLFHGPLRQLQHERLQSAQIKLQRRIIIFVGATSLLEFAIGFGPALLSIKNHATPKGIALRNALGSGFGCRPKRFVNFESVMRIQSAHKINRPRDNCLSHLIESRRVHRCLGSVETIQRTESAGQLNRLATRQQRRATTVFHCTRNDRAAAHPGTEIPYATCVPLIFRGLARTLDHAENNSHRFLDVLRIGLGKSKDADDAFSVGGLQVSAFLNETRSSLTNELRRGFSPGAGVGSFGEEHFIADIAHHHADTVRFRLRIEWNCPVVKTAKSLFRYSIGKQCSHQI